MPNTQKNKQDICIGIIGGSGLYALDSISNLHDVTVDTPYGPPSDSFVAGEVDNAKIYFLARHGKHHTFLPSEVPYRANIYAFKKLGVSHLISISAVGSMREEMPPRDMVVVDQYIDFSKHRVSTFLGEGLIGHVSMAQPTCENLNKIIYDAAYDTLKDSNQTVHPKGTYLCMEGPQFSSLAESKFYRSMNVDIIGMTNMPEAKLAREAQIAYASLAMVTDYDCWHSTEEAVTADMALANMRANTANAQKIITKVIAQINAQKPTSIAHNALEQAIFTSYEHLNQEKKELLDFLKG